MIRCDDCRYWIRSKRKDEGTGYCHRRAPTPAAGVAGHLSMVAYWPILAPDDGCGEGITETAYRRERETYIRLVGQ